MQESRMDPNAVSPVGAAGLAQFMPGTWDDVTRRLGWGKAISRHMAKPAIEAGAYYQGQLRRQWGAAGRTPLQRNQLGQAAYNAGMGNILAAQRRCGDARLWEQISPCQQQVTGRYAHETLTYVERIDGYRRQKEAR